MTTTATTTATKSNLKKIEILKQLDQTAVFPNYKILNELDQNQNIEYYYSLIKKYYGFTLFNIKNYNKLINGIKRGFKYSLFIPNKDRKGENIDPLIYKKLMNIIKEGGESQYFENIIVNSGYYNEELNINMLETTHIILFNSIDHRFIKIYNDVKYNFDQDTILITHFKNLKPHKIKENHNILFLFTYNDEDTPTKDNINNIFFDCSKMNLEEQKEEIKEKLEIIKQPLKKFKSIKLNDLPEDIIDYIYEIKDKDQKDEKQNKHYKLLSKINYKNLRRYLKSDQYRHHLEYETTLKTSIDHYNLYYDVNDNLYKNKAKNNKRIINDNIKILNNKKIIHNRFFITNLTFFNYCFSKLNIEYTTYGARMSRWASFKNKRVHNMRLIPNYSNLLL